MKIDNPIIKKLSSFLGELLTFTVFLIIFAITKNILYAITGGIIIAIIVLVARNFIETPDYEKIGEIKVKKEGDYWSIGNERAFFPKTKKKR